MKIKILLVLLFTLPGLSQTVFVPLENGVYDYLNRLSLKKLIQTDDEAKPFSRKYIAEKLFELEQYSTELNSVENDELSFYQQEYRYELSRIYNQNEENKLPEFEERWFLYSHSDSFFNIKLSPIAGYGLSTYGGNGGRTRWVGASVFAAYSDWFGASFSLRDRGEFGDNVDKDKSFSHRRGAWYKSAPNGIEYSDVIGSINFDFDWGSVSLIKDYFQWGHGNYGSLILSDKAPSYPHIRLQLKPVPWLRFSYIHGWLNSQVYDSAYFYNTYPGTISERLVKAYINKYIAANMITVSPLDWLDVSAGNAVVYGGDLRPEFFIPFMFFKFLDHNTGKGDVEDSNGMMYFDVSVKYPENFQFYSTLFVDVTEIRNILDNDFDNTWIGFTIGGKTVDLILDNLDLSVEYTRINPWLYEHKDEVTTYKHLSYPLGHWLGQNADQIRVQFNYQLLRGLKFKLYAERLRKGGQEEIYYAYRGLDEKDLPFLYPPVREEKRIGIEASFEYIHDLFIVASFEHADITDEDAARLPEFLLGNKNYLLLTLYYNL